MGIFRRGQVWWMSFTIKGKQIQKSCKTKDKKLAAKIYGKVIGQVAEGEWFERPLGADKTLGELLDKYIKEHSEPNKEARTTANDRSMAKEMKEFFGDRTLGEISTNDISAYMSMCRDKGLSASSLDNRRILLHHAFKLAIREWEWLKVNPVENVSRIKLNNKRERWLTDEEEERLLAASPYWLQEIIHFALNTGMRRGEILSLEWSNVDLFRRTLTILKQKNKEKSTLPLNEGAMQVLKARAKVRAINGLVFYDHKGTKIASNTINRAFIKAIDDAKITDFRFHDLRHTFATRLVQSGKDIYMVKNLMRHESIKMTERYSHHYPESLRDTVEALDNRKRVTTNLQQSNVIGDTAVTTAPC